MRRVNTDDNLAAIPSNGLIEVCQDARNADSANDQYISIGLLASAAQNTAQTDALAAVVAGGESETVIATADGLTTGLISSTAVNVEVTSDDATKQATLPAAVDGKILYIVCPAVGCELVSVVPGDKINNVVVGATNEAALVAGTTYKLRYNSNGTNWVMTGLTALGAVETPVVPDAL